MTNQNFSQDNNLESVLDKALRHFLDYAAGILGEAKALEFLHESYQQTLNYYSPLSLLRYEQDAGLTLENGKISDKEILGFSLWMERFSKKLSDFMIGIGKIQPEEILAELAEELKQLGFFEYYEHAGELGY
ncbi:MAG: hypothetical protein JXL67_13935 [Calditrichaeota bacterium]|nr:hypothetical protein [Calditrichota bacterium]